MTTPATENKDGRTVVRLADFPPAYQRVILALIEAQRAADAEKERNPEWFDPALTKPQRQALLRKGYEKLTEAKRQLVDQSR